jgi:hypothetical protein
MRDAPARAGCPAPEDLTALAHGEGRGETRSVLLRHVLSCPACRAEHAASERMLLALRGLGAARASQAPLGPRPLRSRPLRWAWVPPAVAAAAVALALLAPFESRPRAAMPAPAPERRMATQGNAPSSARTEQNVLALLAAQQPDGRWTAEPGLESRSGDEAATALVLLALLHPGAEALRHGPLASAVATGSRWLVGRAAGLGSSERAGPADVRTRAVVSAALLRAESLTHDPSLKAPARSLLAAVTRDAEGASDHVSRPWLDYALTMAQEAGWAGAERDRRTLAASPRPVEPSPDLRARGSATPTRADGATGTAVGRAIEALRDEPSLKPLGWSRTSFSVSATPR